MLESLQQQTGPSTSAGGALFRIYIYIVGTIGETGRQDFVRLASSFPAEAGEEWSG